MSSLISDIEFVVGRGLQYDPAPGATQYRNPVLKNRSFRPSAEGSGFLPGSKFIVVNDTVNDVYGFDLLGGQTFLNGQAWIISLYSNTVVTDLENAPTLIDTSYFIRNIFLPNAESNAATKAKIEQFIAQHEPELLQKIMGYALYKEFFENVTGNAPLEKYEDLLFGKEYTDAKGYLQKWMGFVNPQKLSLIANYVYYQYATDAQTLTTSIGESKQKAEHGSRVSSDAKAVRAWNEMRQWLAQFIDFMEAHQTDYPLWNVGNFPAYEFQNTNTWGI